MNNSFKYFLSAALLIGSFSGSYYGRKAFAPGAPILEADKIISDPLSDTKTLEKAFDLADLAIKTDPSNCKALMLEALSLQRRNLFKEAAKKYEALIPEAENFAMFAHFNLAVLNEATGDNAGAENNYARSLMINNQVPLFWANLIKLNIKQQKLTEAKAQLSSALKMMPNAPELLALKSAVGL